MARAMKTTRRRERWAESRGAVMAGRPLSAPNEAEKKYRRALERLILRMRREYEREVKATLSAGVRAGQIAQDSNIGVDLGTLFSRLGSKWSKIFVGLSREIAGDFMSRVDRMARTRLNSSLEELSGGLTIRTAKMPEALRPKIAAATRANVGLIRSIQASYHERIEQAVMNSVTVGGDGAAEIFDEVMRIGESSEDRARLIARDQTHKISAAINQERMLSAGVERFKWRHSGGSFEPRELHMKYDGEIFDVANPPVIDERTGERGMPGQAINCRCVAIPVLDFSGE